jgi:hypothetical protein
MREIFQPSELRGKSVTCPYPPYSPPTAFRLLSRPSLRVRAVLLRRTGGVGVGGGGARAGVGTSRDALLSSNVRGYL